jgi:crossover junction endodeoxyribonuclease RuvC
MQNKKVIAIDPGFDRLGVAVLEGKSNEPKLLYSECVVTKAKDSHETRLLQIGERLKEIIEEWKPQTLAIETLFFNKNTTSAIKVAEARGVILYEASRAGLNVFEYSPQAIKIAVTGYGNSDKLQVESMVRKLITMPSKSGKMFDDELDAIAVGITHIATKRGI